MTKYVSYAFETANAEQTELLGMSIGRALHGGEVLELRSDLGGGKTTFVRGLARGAGSPDQVASPTFTVSREYETPSGLRIYHFDFYRLAEAGIMEQELAEIADDPQAVVVVEWSDIVQHVLPAGHILLEIAATGDETRRCTVTLPADKVALLKEARAAFAPTAVARDTV